MLNIELKEGAPVVTADGKDAGRINRFVLDPVTNAVTHIVVQKGWLLAEDKVVPFEMVGSSADGKLVLSEDLKDLDQLPAFEETHYVQANDERCERPGLLVVPTARISGLPSLRAWPVRLAACGNATKYPG